MKKAILIAAALCLAGPSAPAQSPGPHKTKPVYDESAAALGASTYRTYCAACHGKEGRGDGVLAGQLRVRPPDLTKVADRNKGTFPTDRIARIVDGRQAVKAHGDSDMPVWGEALLKTREAYNEEQVKKQISDLVSFIASIQE